MGRAEVVLAQLDQAATDFRFPDLNHGFYYAADARLHAYGDATRWGLAVEAVGYSPRGGNLIDVVHTFGDCLTSGQPGYDNDDFHWLINNMDNVEPRDDPERFLGAESLVIRGQAVPVSAPKGEHLSSTFRRLVPAHRDLLFDDERARRRLPADLPELLRLEEWNQPEYPFEVAPSESEAYQLIAAVLESLDPSWYQPTLAPNTRWQNWPESGSL